MAYNRKYYLPFSDRLGDQWELELAAEDYAGSEYLVYGTGNPVIMNDPNRGKGKFTPIKGTKLDMNLLISPALKEMFQDDFGTITDRQWRAILRKTIGDNLYKANFSIDTLNITNTGSNSSAEIQIDHHGGEPNPTECLLDFNLDPYGDQLADSGEYFRLAAVPEGKTMSDDEAIELLYVDLGTATGTTDIEKVTNALEDNVKFTIQSEPTAEYDYYRVKFVETDYVPEYDTNWQIKAYYSKINYEPISGTITYYYKQKNYNFYAMEEQWIEINLIQASENTSGTPAATTLARHSYADQEYLDYNLISNDLASQIANFGTAPQIYFPDQGVYRDVEFDADVDELTPGNFTIIIKDLGEIGNIPIRNQSEYTDGRINDTYIEFRQINGGDYAWTKENMTGGSTGGDNFQFQVDKGSGYSVIAETTAFTDDTIDSILSRLLNRLNTDYAIYEAEINPTNASEIIVQTEKDASTWTYKFTTDGGSTVSPNTDTNWELQPGTEIKWIGWVIPGIYKEQRTAGYVEINLTAVDGLGDLKNIEYLSEQVTGFELKNFLSILSYLLRRTGFNLDLYEAFDLYELNMNDQSSPLRQVFQDTTRLNGKNCYEILTEIAILCKGELIQNNGHWELRPKDQLSKSFNYRVYSAYGVYKEDVEKTFEIIDVGGKQYNNILVYNNTETEYAGAYREVQIKQDYGFVDQLLKFPSFSNIKDYLNDENLNVNYPWQFRFNGTSQSSFLSKIKRYDDYIVILSDFAQSNRFYLSQIFQIGNVEQGDTRDKQFELTIRYIEKEDDVTAAESFDMQLKVTSGDTDLYLNEDDENGYKWETTENSITIPAKTKTGDTTYSIKFNYPRTEIEPDNARAEIKFFQALQGSYRIKTVELKVNAIADVGLKKSSYHSQNRNELTFEKYEKDVNLGDVPALANAKQLYKNALYYLDDNGNNFLTSLWTTDPNATTGNKGLLDHVRHFYLSEYAKTVDGVDNSQKGPPVILTTNILGPMNFRDIVRLRTFDDKLFTLTGGKWDIKKRIISGEWEQIDIDNTGLNVVDEQKAFSEDSSGSNTYTTYPGGDSSEGGETQTDLSNYLTQDQIEFLITGKTGSFLGSDLVNRSINIYHGLGYEPTFIVILRNGKQINPANYEFDTGETTTHINVTLSVPFQPGDRFKYRIL